MAHPLSIRFTDEERAVLDQRAATAGVKPSAYMRDLLRKAGGLSTDPVEQLQDHEQRITRLEEVAGL